jgi:hypothetical protein
LNIGKGVIEDLFYLKADEGKGNFKFMDKYFPGKEAQQARNYKNLKNERLDQNYINAR